MAIKKLVLDAFIVKYGAYVDKNGDYYSEIVTDFSYRENFLPGKLYSIKPIFTSVPLGNTSDFEILFGDLPERIYGFGNIVAYDFGTQVEVIIESPDEDLTITDIGKITLTLRKASSEKVGHFPKIANKLKDLENQDLSKFEHIDAVNSFSQNPIDIKLPKRARADSGKKAWRKDLYLSWLLGIFVTISLVPILVPHAVVIGLGFIVALSNFSSVLAGIFSAHLYQSKLKLFSRALPEYPGHVEDVKDSEFKVFVAQLDPTKVTKIELKNKKKHGLKDFTFLDHHLLIHHKGDLKGTFETVSLNPKDVEHGKGVRSLIIS